MSVTPAQAEYIARIAEKAAEGITGFPPARESELVDTIILALIDIAGQAEQRGVDATCVQLSIEPGAARVVG